MCPFKFRGAGKENSVLFLQPATEPHTAAHSLLACLPSPRWRQARINLWVEVRAVQRVKQNPCTKATKPKQLIYHFFMGRQVFNHLRNACLSPSVTSNGHLGRQTPSLCVLPFLFHWPALHAEHDTTWAGISLGSAEIRYPRCLSPYIFSPQPHQW